MCVSLQSVQCWFLCQPGRTKPDWHCKRSASGANLASSVTNMPGLPSLSAVVDHWSVPLVCQTLLDWFQSAVEAQQDGLPGLPVSFTSECLKNSHESSTCCGHTGPLRRLNRILLPWQPSPLLLLCGLPQPFYTLPQTCTCAVQAEQQSCFLWQTAASISWRSCRICLRSVAVPCSQFTSMTNLLCMLVLVVG